MKTGALLTISLLALAAIGCDGASAASGAGEPILVRGGQFVAGSIPVGTTGPEIITIESQNNLVTQGQAGKKLNGDAKKGATAVAARFADTGTGYWIVPVGPPDPQTDGDLTWELVSDLARDLQPGKHALQIAASNEAGDFGPIHELPLFVQSLVPDGKAVITLQWDSNADLDLHVLTPTGKQVDSKHLTTWDDPDGGAPPPGTGVLDRDSNAGCALDGYRQEDLVFTEDPPPGAYALRIDLFAACGAPAANFVVTARKAGAVVFTQKGRLLDVDADGDTGTGLFIGQVTF